MADLRGTIAGIKSPNPFWLASAPPTDKEYNIVRAFKAGWGGVVWKTLGEDPPVVNVSSRYGALLDSNRAMIGFNNIELITDRPLEVNLREIAAVKKAWPDRAVVVSLMAVMTEEAWAGLARRIEPTGADGLELNFGCPHGMCERGMGSAIGQVPEMVEQVTRWVKNATRLPVIVKLTPNITNVLWSAEAAKRGGADAVSLINTVNSIASIDLDAMAPTPTVGGKGTHGGYCGPAVKPIALNMVAEIARNPDTRGLPISGIGGIGTWRDAAEFLALGCGSVQVCTAAMTYGFRIVEDMIDGLSAWMDEKGYRSLADFQGRAVPNVVNWNDLNMNFVTKAKIDKDLCIDCGRCHIACEDTSHQAIRILSGDGKRLFEVVDEECVGCNLCAHVCPVPDCITMHEQDTGRPYLTWPEHPQNPARIQPPKAAE
ncbi:dihydroorotate oxidase B catalytic subunit /dihydrouracil dehydrogenase (NAD+) /dihydropyrimidine dehydrogenase (NADP+) [Nitrospirillum amazonense]|uniref:dihydrouracil dehydrogenase (NAD(+)) n=1 Tax=Nitrospirillum amazonense TaxID=28077 RepID=A0A560FPI0_9PROT|nr:NAD-dependent dihydropyrimidine dehydrogenase subunit PreA [Nitrospirillum amazonense]TWB23515.1 dihydroorotate oxidase B catalytic subunit /dihydrouracil dehydrogenase (NAD+) /dihydropyrimidine dehydrogenase (NADP+) [Nitrospirillum amazonense]